MWRNVASNALTLFVVLLVAAGGFVAWAQQQYVSSGPLPEPICVQVERGSSFRGVSEALAEQGAVSHAALLRVGADYSGKASQLKAGSFLVPEGASMAEIVEIVTRGGQSTCGTEVVYRIGVTSSDVLVRRLDPATNRFETEAEFDPAAAGDALPAEYVEAREDADTRFRVQLAEGATVWQVVESLKAADFLSGEIGEMPPEGMIAPDSYEVEPGADRAALVARMVETQEERLAEAWRNRQDGLPVDTPEEALILASIVEKETGVPEERPQVASVFVNRMREGMRLQTDPTVIYGITGGEGPLGRGLRRKELEAETPYNTYRIDGLPPTPIANPGLASLQAALNPAETDYLYFVADGTGGHAFARSLQEHNRNVQAWRAVEAQRAGQ